MESAIGKRAVGSGSAVRGTNGKTPPGGVNPPQSKTLILEALTTHAPALLRTARRHSVCADDAQDAYQRGLEILLRRADSLDPARAVNWLHTVIKHEAMAVRRARQQLVGGVDEALDATPAVDQASPEEQVISWERTTQAAEALQRLKPQEIKALWLKASGLSYAEIAERESWTYTKVNRCLAEGRKRFLERYAEIESGAECDRWAPLLSALVDGEATAEQLAELRPHLRNCAACKATVRQLHESGDHLAGVLPAGLIALPSAAGVEQGSLSRAWDAVVAATSERATLVAVKLQSAGDALTAGKLAAVAASTAVAAGGGAAVVERSRGADPEPRLSPPAAATAAHRAQTQRASTSRAKRSSARSAQSRASKRGLSDEFSRDRAASADQVGAEFGPETNPAPATPRPTESKPRPSSARSGAEFDP